MQVLIRLVFLLALGAVGYSSLYSFLYLALPGVAALLLSQKDGERYFAEDAPGIVRALRWVSAAYAYLWLLTDEFQTREDRSAVELGVETGGNPTPASALLRLIFSLPALVLLAVVSVPALLLWLIGAIVILVRRRIPEGIADFLGWTFCYQVRLLAYHLSLVERYPSFDDVFVEPRRRPGAA